MNYEPFIVKPGSQIRLQDYDPDYTGDVENKEVAEEPLKKRIQGIVAYYSGRSPMVYPPHGGINYCQSAQSFEVGVFDR